MYSGFLLAKPLVIEPHVLLALLGAELDGVALATGMYAGFLLAGGAKRVGIGSLRADDLEFSGWRFCRRVLIGSPALIVLRIERVPPDLRQRHRHLRRFL